jgi:hypothetical protein
MTVARSLRPTADKPQEPGLYVPPSGLSFRLTGKAFDKDSDPVARLLSEFGGARDRLEARTDQYLSLLHGTGVQQGMYALKNTVESFLPFNIPSRAPSSALAEQYWRFDFEPVDVVDVKWDLDAATIVRTKTRCAADVVVKNDLKQPQTFNWTYTEDLAWMGIATRTDGFPLRSDVTITSGLPTLVGDKLIMDDKVFNWKVGPTVEVAYARPDTYTYTVPALSTAHAFAMTANAQVDVPFEIRLKGKTSGVETSTKGVWHGSISGHYAPLIWYNHCSL